MFKIKETKVNTTKKLTKKSTSKKIVQYDIEELDRILLKHCIDMTALNKKSKLKKVNSILDCLVGAIVRSGTTIKELKEFIIDVNNDKVLNIEFLNVGGNLKNYIKPKWYKLMYSIWRQRSIGLGTPNSASGEAELMFILSSPQIKKPRKGDLYINKKIKELKGEEARVNGNISGKQFRKKTIDIAKKYNLTLNKSAKSEKYSAELEKTKHLKHWKNELNKLTLNKQKSFIYEWLKCVSYDFEYENINKNENKIFINGKFNHKNFIKEIVKLLFNETIKNNNFDSFILLGDGTNTKVINGNKDVFNEKIDNGEIIINKDYFRINQPGMIGWYIE